MNVARTTSVAAAAASAVFHSKHRNSPNLNSTFQAWSLCRNSAAGSQSVLPFTGAGRVPAVSVSILSRSTGIGVFHLTQARKSTVDASLKGISDSSIAETVKHILEKANRASLRREVLHTDFLAPPVLKESLLALEKLVDIDAVPHGGYPQAERCRLSVGHPDASANTSDVVAALSITGNFGFQPCSHGDFLGAVIGLGIAREKIGDIMLKGEEGAQVLVVPELVDFVILSLNKVGNVPVSCTRIPLDALKYEEPRIKTFRTIENSARLDAVASAGFKISRSKLVDLISKGDVRINWSTVVKNGTVLKPGDVISVTGKGRLKIGEINTTKKGKYAVELIRYL